MTGFEQLKEERATSLPVEKLTSVMRYLADLGLLEHHWSYVGDYGNFGEYDGRIEGRVYDDHSRTKVMLSRNLERGTARVEAAMDTSQGAYDVCDIAASGESDNEFMSILPTVLVRRNGYEHEFRDKYAERAAELILRLMNRRMAEVGHREVTRSTERARIAQAALARYEESTS